MASVGGPASPTPAESAGLPAIPPLPGARPFLPLESLRAYFEPQAPCRLKIMP